MRKQDISIEQISVTPFISKLLNLIPNFDELQGLFDAKPRACCNEKASNSQTDAIRPCIRMVLRCQTSPCLSHTIQVSLRKTHTILNK